MSPREIWCNEAQERYVLALDPPILTSSGHLRSRALPVRGAGQGDRDDGRLVVEDPKFRDKPIDVELEWSSASRRGCCATSSAFLPG